MSVDFSQLLAADRLRPLWGPGASAEDEETGGEAAAGGDPAARRRARRRRGRARHEDDTLDELREEALDELGETAEDEVDELLTAEDLDERDAAEVLPEPQPDESPLRVLDKLEQAMYVALGPRASLLALYTHPLRRALSRLEGESVPPHPLQSALETRDLRLLVYGLEDAFRGLLQARQRFGQ